jgi:hypothetical protein
MIRLAEDVGAPVLVTAADLLVEQTKPTASDMVGIGLAAVGYIGSYMGYGGPMVKNIGIAAAPWAFKAIINKVKGAGVTGMAVRQRVARWPAEPWVKGFEGNRLD